MVSALSNWIVYAGEPTVVEATFLASLSSAVINGAFRWAEAAR
jgi:hypothetical protein